MSLLDIADAPSTSFTYASMFALLLRPIVVMIGWLAVNGSRYELTTDLDVGKNWTKSGIEAFLYVFPYGVVFFILIFIKN